MNFDDAKKRVSELTDIINYHSRLYYVENNPELEDYEFDRLMQELKKLEEEFPSLKVQILLLSGSAVKSEISLRKSLTQFRWEVFRMFFRLSR